MGTTYAVSWRESKGSTKSGRLELGQQGLRLHGAASLEIPYDDVTRIALGREQDDRLGGRMTLVLDRLNAGTIWIAPVAQRAALLELHDRLSTLSGNDPFLTPAPEPGVDLYWLPLGAGGHSVRLNGRVFEAVVARAERRTPCDLYHSALEVRVPEGRFVIEQAPVRDDNGAERGVVAEGAVASGWAGRFRIFRYEVRCWRGGIIPDVNEAVESPKRLTDDPVLAQRMLELVPNVPRAVWGRDELGAGEMWNSNSLIAWLIARCGLSADSIQPPTGGRAPGWRAGLVVAGRQESVRLCKPRRMDEPKQAPGLLTK